MYIKTLGVLFLIKRPVLISFRVKELYTYAFIFYVFLLCASNFLLGEFTSDVGNLSLGLPGCPAVRLPHSCCFRECFSNCPVIKSSIYSHPFLNKLLFHGGVERQLKREI